LASARLLTARKAFRPQPLYDLVGSRLIEAQEAMDRLVN
jgi:hypothetical protein